MRVEINLPKITENAIAITGLCADQGITVIGVTKSCCGMPEVARAMVAGGVGGLADSRLSNLRRMKEAGIKAHMLLLRSPALSDTTEAVRVAEASFNSELAVVASLAHNARIQGRVHQVILMVDVGDGRDGLLPEDVAEVARKVECLDGIQLLGLGSNIGCLTENLPSPENAQVLVQLADQVETAIGRRLAVISGGSSVHLRMVAQHRLPARINQLRIGEGILLGSDPADSRPIPGTSQDAFALSAEVIEVKWKPTLTRGESADNLRPQLSAHEVSVPRCHAIVAVGTQDVRIEGLRLNTPEVRIIGASSDHLVLDVTDRPVKVGDELEFGLRYTGLMTAMASPYVRKVILSNPAPDPS